MPLLHVRPRRNRLTPPWRRLQVSLAFTSTWLAVSSQLGHYRKLHGPQVLLQVRRRAGAGRVLRRAAERCLPSTHIPEWPCTAAACS